MVKVIIPQKLANSANQLFYLPPIWRADCQTFANTPLFQTIELSVNQKEIKSAGRLREGLSTRYKLGNGKRSIPEGRAKWSGGLENWGLEVRECARCRKSHSWCDWECHGAKGMMESHTGKEGWEYIPEGLKTNSTHMGFIMEQSRPMGVFNQDGHRDQNKF